jgi:hypothetical protein
MIGKRNAPVKNFFTVLWKLWGLFAVYIPILVLSPLILASILFFRYKVFWKIERFWARLILSAMGFKPSVRKIPPRSILRGSILSLPIILP